MSPVASSTDALSPVPPMSMARVNGRAGPSARGVPPLIDCASSSSSARSSMADSSMADLPFVFRWERGPPAVVMERLGQGRPLPPALAFEVRHRLEVRDSPDAQPRHRPDRFGDLEQPAQEVL